MKLGDPKGTAIRLARVWGQTFGHNSKQQFGQTFGIMKQLLAGDAEIGVRAYDASQIEAAIHWLAEGAKVHGIEVGSAGLLQEMLPDFIKGKEIGQTWVVKKNKKTRRRTVKII